MNTKTFRSFFINSAIFTLILLFGFGLIGYSEQTSARAASGIELCLTVLVPSLFPFFVLSALVINTGMAHGLGVCFTKPMSWLFDLPGASAPAFILGLVGGYPVGAKTAISLYGQGVLCKHDTERLLAFCNNCGPAFVLGVVGGGVFKNIKVGVLLYLIHILSSVLVGVIFKLLHNKKHAAKHLPTLTPPTCDSFTKSFISAVCTSFASILNICAFVIFFAVAIEILSLMGITGFFAGVCDKIFFFLPFDTAFYTQLFSGMIEVTSGVWQLATHGPSAFNFTLAAFMLGWAGLCVHFQVLSFIIESGLSTRLYLFGKLLHGILSAALTWVALGIFPEYAHVFSPLVDVVGGTPSNFAFFAVSAMACMGIWLIFILLSKLSIVFFSKRRYNM